MTQICPVPLPSWLSDSGKGIQVVAVVHGEAQLTGRWGAHGRQVVLDTSSVKVFPARHHRRHYAAGGGHAVRDPGHDPAAARPATGTWPLPSPPARPRTTCACTGLDVLSGLWLVLCLQPARTARLLSAQAEYQARILPALAAQLITETSRCGHTPVRSMP